jgi:predicted DNA binding CopG/RHH family protein
LRSERGVSFEEVVFHIERGDVLDIIEHPNQKRYRGQRVMVVQIGDYVYLVPCLDEEDYVVLKTIIPSRKGDAKIPALGGRKQMKLDPSEKDLLDSVEKGEWKSVRGLKEERKRYAGYAAATFRKDRRVNIRISGKDLEALQKKALEEGLPYQTLISSLIHKFVSGRLQGI